MSREIPECTLDLEGGHIVIRINGVMHLRLKQEWLVCIQSWIIGHKRERYFIEYTTKYGRIECDYVSRTLWEKILELLTGI